MKTQIFKRSKAKWENEQIALADVMQLQNLSSENLKPVHDEKQFAWEVITVSNDDFFVIAINKVTDVSDAIQKAMEHLDTFEGNLKADHTDTEFRFSRVR